jgi:uncharacterized protein (TIGR02453 family)
MSSDTSEAFQGFRPAAFQFLVELALNNERSWFQPRKADYDRLLKEPLEALCVSLDAEFRTHKVPLASDPARSPFRIYRDVRFSRDKSPYKTAVSASFPWTGEGSGVGGYVHIEPGHAYLGGGMWHPAPERLAAWRRAVVEDRERIHAVIDDRSFRGTFGDVGGDRLLRGPAGFPKDDPDIELLKLKDVTFGVALSDAEAQSAALPALIADRLSVAVPVLGLLAALPGDPGATPWLRE